MNGNTTLQGATTCLSSLNVSGTLTGTTATLYTTTGTLPRLILSGAEFSEPINGNSTEGMAILLGINRAGNKQIWFTNSATLAKNNTNTVL